MLTLVATPIGNLGDISFRAVEALQNADTVFCEDTRRTLQLLNHLNIRKTLVSCHEHNERARAEEVTERLRRGENIVYVSDAGMPGISDPGAVLVSACLAAGLEYTVIPGASAVLTAAVLSGLPCRTFSFFGFLPRESRQRKQTLDRIMRCGHLAILFESPHRVGDTLRILAENGAGEWQAAVLRELTKKYESAIRGTVAELAAKFTAEEPRGECVITVLCEEPGTADPGQEEIERILREALAGGMSAKDAAAAASKTTGIRKNTAYGIALRLKEMSEGKDENEQDQGSD